MGERTLHLAGSDVVSVLNKVGRDEFMDCIIDSVEASFVLFEEGRIKCPSRSGFYFPGGGCGVYACHVGGRGCLFEGC